MDEIPIPSWPLVLGQAAAALGVAVLLALAINAADSTSSDATAAAGSGAPNAGSASPAATPTFPIKVRTGSPLPGKSPLGLAIDNDRPVSATGKFGEPIARPGSRPGQFAPRCPGAPGAFTREYVLQTTPGLITINEVETGRRTSGPIGEEGSFLARSSPGDPVQERFDGLIEGNRASVTFQRTKDGCTETWPGTLTLHFRR